MSIFFQFKTETQIKRVSLISNMVDFNELKR